MKANFVGGGYSNSRRMRTQHQYVPENSVIAPWSSIIAYCGIYMGEYARRADNFHIAHTLQGIKLSCVVHLGTIYEFGVPDNIFSVSSRACGLYDNHLSLGKTRFTSAALLSVRTRLITFSQSLDPIVHMLLFTMHHATQVCQMQETIRAFQC
jgi:hypothetical protein